MPDEDSRWSTRTEDESASSPIRSTPDPLKEGPVGPADKDLIEVDEEVRNSIRILVVDDERTLRESCTSILETEGFGVTACRDGEDAIAELTRARYDIVIIDLYMSSVSGTDIMEKALEVNPDCLPIVMTGKPSVRSSIEVLRAGAWSYLPKPFSATHLQLLVGRAAHAVMIARESRREKEERRRRNGHSEKLTLLGDSPQFQKVVDDARKVARTDAPVFVTGESGTGKELIAQFIHHHSRRSSRNMVPVNCAAIPENLLESEMFGHVEGAFTGAVKEKEGLLEAANGGTLLLDEITEMPLSLQAKLLRVIQDGIIRRVGSTQTDGVVDVRFIAATNQDPRDAIEDEMLREDLHYRLRVFPIHIPPLRERTEDIPVLARHFLFELWEQHRGSSLARPSLAEETIRALKTRPWAGNVRELRNVIERTVVMAEPGETIGPQDVAFLDSERRIPDGRQIVGKEYLFHDEYHTARDRVLRDFELGYLRHVVRQAEGNISDAARIAGVDRTTLYRLMEKHDTEKQELLDGSSPPG